MNELQITHEDITGKMSKPVRQLKNNQLIKL